MAREQGPRLPQPTNVELFRLRDVCWRELRWQSTCREGGELKESTGAVADREGGMGPLIVQLLW